MSSYSIFTYAKLDPSPKYLIPPFAFYKHLPKPGKPAGRGTMKERSFTTKGSNRNRDMNSRLSRPGHLLVYAYRHGYPTIIKFEI